MTERALQNKDYDLLSVVYHASQGCETCETYAADAEQKNDNEARDFFNEAYRRNAELVEKGKQLLKARL